MSRIARIIIPQQSISIPRRVVEQPPSEIEEILLEDNSGVTLLESGDKIIQE